MSESEFSDNFTHRIIHSDNHYRPIVTPDIIREEKEKYHDGLSPSVVQQFNYLAQAYDNTPEKKRTLYPYQRALQKQVKFSTVKPKVRTLDFFYKFTNNQEEKTEPFQCHQIVNQNFL